MIHHLSIAARNPQHVAEVLAECMGGAAVPFPPNPGSFFALALDDKGTGIEVYPAGTELRENGAAGGSFVREPDARPFTATHFALSVEADIDTIQRIAVREGWPCYVVNRGFFHVMELWIEGNGMVEILPPPFAKEYLDFARPENVERFRSEHPQAGTRAVGR
jgi:hypothetical protein